MINLKNISIETGCNSLSGTHEIRLDWDNDFHQLFPLDNLTPESVANVLQQLVWSTRENLIKKQTIGE